MPDYLKVPEHSSAKIWGTLEKYDGKWIVKGHPYMISLAKRLFPGSKGNGHGSANFPASKRIVGDISWFMQRFPLDIKDNDAWLKDLAEAQKHFEVQESMLKKPKKVLPAPEFKGELKEFQKEGLAFLLHNPRSLLADEMGLGKSLDLNTNVLTPDGWKRIGDISIGDKVIGSDGKTTNVIGVYPQGIRKLYRITFNDGHSILADEEHLWVVNNRNACRGEPSILLTTKEMMDKNGTKTHKGNGHNKNKTYEIKTYFREPSGNNKWQIPLVKPIFFNEKKLSIEPYLLGALLGDGGLSGKTIYFTTSDKELLEGIERLLPKKVMIKKIKHSKYDYRLIKTERDGLFNILKKHLKELDLCGKTSDLKFIPDAYKYSSPENRLALLQGLMDTDGCPLPDGYGTEYCSVSKHLALDVKELVETLGGIARLKTRQPYYTHNNVRKKGKLAYRLNIKLPEGANPFRLKRKAEKYKIPSKYKANRYIKDIKYEKDDEAICIKVDVEDGLFVVDHCIVTHNTPTAISWLTSLNCSPPYIVIVPPHLLRQWKSEIGKFLGEETSVHIIKGLKPYSLPASEIYLIHYLLLRGWKNYLPRFGFKACVFDEIQDLRHATSDKYSAASLLAESTDNVIGLSGTPIYGYGTEMFNVLNILDFHCLGDFDNFSREWCTGYGEKLIRDPKLLGEYLRTEGLLLRRRKEDVLSELPPKRRVIQNIDVDEGKYDELIAPIIDQAKRISDIKDAFERGRETMMAIDSTRMITGIAKAHYVCAFVKTLMEAGETVILYGHHHKVMDIYIDELKDSFPVMISGRQSPIIKDEAQKAFMNGDTDLIIISLRSATGLNLQRARCVVFGELDWSPAVMVQGEDRCIVEGQLIRVKNKGLTPVENVSIGDFVLSHDGQYHKVIDRWKHFAHRKGDNLFTKISYYRYFKPLEVTYDHKIFVMKNGEKNTQWIEAHNLLPGDCVLFPRFVNTNKDAKYLDVPDECLHPEYFIDQWGSKHKNGRLKKINTRIKITDDLLFLFGWYIAEGWVTLRDIKGKKGSHVGISGNIKKKDIVVNCGSLLQKHFGKDITISTPREHTGAVEIRAYSIELAKLFKIWFGHEAHSKHIPSYFFEILSKRQLEKLLEGYVAGDGYKRKNQVEWTTVSVLLAQQTTDVASMLGYNPTMRLVQGNQWVCGYTVNGNPSNKKLNIDDENYVVSPINAVETYSSKKWVYDLTVENTPSFTVGSAVVHNCHRIGTKDSVLCYYLTCKAGTDQAMLETLGLKTSQFVSIMGDKEETEHDKLMAQVDTKKHMKQVIELLQKGGRKKEISDEKTIEKLRKLERLPSSKEPTSLSDFYERQE